MNHEVPCSIGHCWVLVHGPSSQQIRCFDNYILNSPIILVHISYMSKVVKVTVHNAGYPPFKTACYTGA